MSGICDTCKREHCHAKMDGLRSCDFYHGGETRYDQLFGSPERVARTMIAVRGECETSKPCYPDCPFGSAPTCPRDCWSDDYAALVEWLRGDA